ncbi:MAG: hypothetical protein AAB917_00965, partial [Patescibacteria group bacterium]
QIHKLNRETYSISTGELEALEQLRMLPPGKILVYDHECLQCEWYGQFRPAVFANSRSYVTKISKKPLVYDAHTLEAHDRPTAKAALEKTKAKYLYLVKYGEYQESVSFSPGDLGIEKVYENARAQIWRVI